MVSGAWCHDQQIFQTTPHGAARLVQGTHRHTFPDQGKFDSTSILWANFIPLIPYGRTVNEDSLENLIGFL